MSGIFIRELVLATRDLAVDVRVIHSDLRMIWPFSRFGRYQVSPAKESIESPPWLVRKPVPTFPFNFSIVRQARRRAPVVTDVIRRAWPGWKPGLIHAHTFIPSAIVADHLANQWQCPMIVTTHGADTRVLIHRRSTRSAILNLCAKGTPVVCVGDPIRAILIRHGARPDNLRVIHNGMDLAKLHRGPNPLRDRYQGKTVIVGVGNLVPLKGFDLLIRAIHRLRPDYPNLHCLIVGDGAERDSLRVLVQRLGLNGVVELVGAKPAAETMTYIHAADIFCLPSWSEGFGIVYLEAMAHAKPVIAVEGQGIADIVKANETGILVPPRDADAVADAIDRLLKNPQAAREMGLRGEKLIRESFTWHHCASNYVRLYEELIGRTVPHQE